MSIIEEFLEQYNRQYDFYTELAKIGSNQLEHELAKRGIKAIVSYRAKKPDRLKAKLEQRNTENPYKNIVSVFDDIVDLAGVRVALYFPSDRELVDQIIKEIFNVKKTKKFPGESHIPKFNKRFSGYWASHYRVNVKGVEKSQKRYETALFEIQVASVLMHAWSEVEHDLVYKPLSGSLSEEEYAILDEINGLVITGEIALERLQKAITTRANKSNRINNRYELTSLITSSLNNNYLKKLKLGDTKIIFNYLSETNDFSVEKLNEYISRVNQSENETISDQLFTMILEDTYNDIKNKNYLEKYFERSLGPARDYSGFESFVKAWIVLEKAVTQINREHNKHYKKFFTAKFENLVELALISKDEALELNDFRKIRNNLLHGYETPPDNELSQACKRLIELTNKILEPIKDASVRDELTIELFSIKEGKYNK
ncbi:GTP pyrophosphokinase [Aeromonas hydrophila]|uniref:GTP pyrophosphokinase n=1 Tax=Aeromonas hydrophila TaxID=644 RepID=UPI002366D07B|nr:RelA/SpoT domain-containing protein [Aeromonas hydrophila]WDF91902.1 RelA/SpoT domain-containing protein [Aeromonas hydrophila subsp. hydrophila]